MQYPTDEERRTWTEILGRMTPLAFCEEYHVTEALGLEGAVKRLGKERSLTGRQMNLINEYLHKQLRWVMNHTGYRPEHDKWWAAAARAAADGTVPQIVLDLELIKSRDLPRGKYVTIEDAEKILAWASQLPGWKENGGGAPISADDLMRAHL